MTRERLRENLDLLGLSSKEIDVYLTVLDHGTVTVSRVVDESDVEAPPIDTAIDEGWATVAAPLEFSEPVVSRVMDGVQRYIANADDRPADGVERANAALAALAAQHLSAGTATEVYIYTTDIAAGEGAETVLASEGYGDSVTFVNGFRFIEDLVAGDS